MTMQAPCRSPPVVRGVSFEGLMLHPMIKHHPS